MGKMEIKFRVVDHKTGLTVGYETWDKAFGWRHELLSDPLESDNTRQLHYGVIEDGPFDDYVREQFSGVHDIDGKEVYFNDTVYSENWEPKEQVVTFDRGGFCLKYEDAGYYHDIKYAEKMKVIGRAVWST